MFLNSKIQYSKIITPIAIIIIAAVFQNSGLLEFLGIKPNFMLSISVVFAFLTESFLLYFLFVAIGLFFLQILPGLEKEILSLFLLLAISFFIRRFLVWRRSLSIAILIAAITFLFYAIVDWIYFVNYPAMIALEAVYNVFIGVLFYILYEKNKIRI